jgi:hypothetical protein
MLNGIGITAFAYGTCVGIMGCCIWGAGTMICAGGLWALFNDNAAIYCTIDAWFAFSWLIALITDSWSEAAAVVALPVDIAAAFIMAVCVSVVSVAVVSSSSSSPKMVYMLFCGA